MSTPAEQVARLLRINNRSGYKSTHVPPRCAQAIVPGVGPVQRTSAFDPSMPELSAELNTLSPPLQNAMKDNPYKQKKPEQDTLRLLSKKIMELEEEKAKMELDLTLKMNFHNSRVKELEKQAKRLKDEKARENIAQKKFEGQAAELKKTQKALSAALDKISAQEKKSAGKPKQPEKQKPRKRKAPKSQPHGETKLARSTTADGSAAALSHKGLFAPPPALYQTTLEILALPTIMLKILAYYPDIADPITQIMKQILDNGIDNLNVDALPARPSDALKLCDSIHLGKLVNASQLFPALSSSTEKESELSYYVAHLRSLLFVLRILDTYKFSKQQNSKKAESNFFTAYQQFFATFAYIPDDNPQQLALYLYLYLKIQPSMTPIIDHPKALNIDEIVIPSCPYFPAFMFKWVESSHKNNFSNFIIHLNTLSDRKFTHDFYKSFDAFMTSFEDENLSITTLEKVIAIELVRDFYKQFPHEIQLRVDQSKVKLQARLKSHLTQLTQARESLTSINSSTPSMGASK